MTDYDRIITLLEKENLSREEKELLKSIIENDQEAKKISTTYLQVKSVLNRKGHIDEELMGEYILYKNNNSPGNWMIILSGMVENHLRQCSDCENMFREFNSEFSETDQFITRTITDTAAGKDSPERKKHPFYKSISAAKYAVASIAAVLVLYLALNVIYSLSIPEYKQSFMEGNDFYATRGRTSELFQRGLDAIDSRNYDNAVRYLARDAEQNSGDESIFYTYFILGITYVNKAESDFLGLFKSYDREDVLNAVNSFKKSIALNNSGRFDNLKLDAHYFLGKSYLLLDNEGDAKEHLKIVAEGKGSYYREAEEILENF